MGRIRMKQRGFVNLLLVVSIMAITAAVTVGVVWLAGGQRGYFSKNTTPYMPRSIAVKTYQSKDGTMEFQYPPKLTVAESKGKISIRHLVYFNHIDPCDLKDGTRKLSTIEDFFVSIEFTTAKDMSDFSHFLPAERPDSEYVSRGDLKGFLVYNGVEGCGEDVYYFPISTTNKILRVTNFHPAEFNEAGTSEAKKYRELPAAILPEEREKILGEILSSFKFLKQ